MKRLAIQGQVLVLRKGNQIIDKVVQQIEQIRLTKRVYMMKLRREMKKRNIVENVVWNLIFYILKY